jgi:N utilization substance protein B
MRRRAREAALRLLYRREFFPEAAAELPATQGLGKEHKFACDLLLGVIAHQEEIDHIIDRRAQGWGIDRLALMDRNILRLALYELLHSDTPPEVVIDEAVELAKRYGTERAPTFINAILDHVWKEGA